MNTQTVYYVVTCDGMSYRYAMHSAKKDKIIFPSQVLRVLEYCLFQKVRKGFRDELTPETFPFDISISTGGETVEDWEGKEKAIEDFRGLLKVYYENIPERMLNSAKN